MKLEDQVCSLELAKRLKELGVEQKSHFYWNTSKNEGFEVEGFFLKIKTAVCFDWENYSAFTVAELGEMFFPNNEPFFKLPARYEEDGLWYDVQDEISCSVRRKFEPRKMVNYVKTNCKLLHNPFHQ